MLKRTPFASALSCIMGIETLVLKGNSDVSRHVDKRRLCVHRTTLVENARRLESISRTIQSEFPSIVVEKKQTYDKLLAGITIDWRKMRNWERPRKAVEAYVMDAASRQKSSNPLHVKVYSSHPFIDIYATTCDKAVGFKSIITETQIKGEGQIMYLGDSENDNPAFNVADISIGIRSDPRLRPPLECDFMLEYNNLASFLQLLLDNEMIFSDDVVKMLELQ